MSTAAVGDHPRSRGVYSFCFLLASTRIGSSPLARGLLLGITRNRCRHRIIPARAGSTYLPEEVTKFLEDHPRSRGVYVPAGGGDEVPGGSSPLARGLLNDLSILVAQERIIPARAGSTATTTTHSWRRSDHPRSRGVYRAVCRVSVSGGGSSPLARGLLFCGLQPADGEGIIPARAGSTSRRCCSTDCAWDHPRSRGVYGMSSLFRDAKRGSSPLARGLLSGLICIIIRKGIIPARAGSTSSPPGKAPILRDHPRSRGVYIDKRAGSEDKNGSSPLARGLPIYLNSDHFNIGIIPARAGSTTAISRSR